MLTPQPSNSDILNAVAEVIRARGFDTLAKEYLSRPADRPQIARIVTRDIARNVGRAESDKFARLAKAAEKMTR